MPGRSSTTRPRRRALKSFDPWLDSGVTLVVIDDTPLKRAAWAELHAARKRQEKAARDLHRHEQVDVPAYDSWLYGTFPGLISLLRELHQEVFAKGRRMQTAQAVAAMTGRSVRKIWRELKAREADPAASESDRRADDEDFRDADSDGAFEDDDDFNERRDARGGRQHWDDAFDAERDPARGARPGREAREVYRRLVQRLHPDRGGEWTLARQRLWHEVQQAWATGDADWLMRLEVEWEAAHDMLSPASALSRLRCAIEEFHAARRDTERKLRTYREAAAWRFTLSEKKRSILHRRTESNFEHDIAVLQRQLAHLDATIASWEEMPQPRPRRGVREVEIWFRD